MANKIQVKTVEMNASVSGEELEKHILPLLDEFMAAFGV